MSTLLTNMLSPAPEYANFAEFSSSLMEIRIHFGLLDPKTSFIAQRSGVILHPMAAKLLARRMNEIVRDWENVHGILALPEDDELTKQLFRGPNVADQS